MGNIEAFERLNEALDAGSIYTREEIVADQPPEVESTLAFGAPPRIESQAYLFDRAPLSPDVLDELVAHGIERRDSDELQVSNDPVTGPGTLGVEFTMRAFRALPGRSISLERPAAVILHNTLFFEANGVRGLPDGHDSTDTIYWLQAEDPAALDRWSADETTYRAAHSATIEHLEAALEQTGENIDPEDYERLGIPPPAHQRFPDHIQPDIATAYIHPADTTFNPTVPRARAIAELKDYLGDAVAMIRPIPVGSIQEEELPRAIGWLLDRPIW